MWTHNILPGTGRANDFTNQVSSNLGDQSHSKQELKKESVVLSRLIPHSSAHISPNICEILCSIVLL